MMQRAAVLFVGMMLAWLMAATVVLSAKPDDMASAREFAPPPPLDLEALRSRAAANQQKMKTSRDTKEAPQVPPKKQELPVKAPNEPAALKQQPDPPSKVRDTPPDPPPLPKQPASDEASLIVEFAPLSSFSQADDAAAKMRASSASSSSKQPRPLPAPSPRTPPSVLSLLRTLFAGRKSEEPDFSLPVSYTEDELLNGLIRSGLTGFNFTLLELGSDGSALSLKIARMNPHATVLSIDGNPASIAKQAAHLRLAPARNYLLGQRRVNETLIADLLSSFDLFEFLLLRTPFDLVSSLLPLELEEQLGRLFALARSTFVFIPNSEDLERHGCNPRYFSYWSSHRALITAAAASARLFVTIENVYAQQGESLFRVDLVDLPWRRLHVVDRVTPLLRVPSDSQDEEDGEEQKDEDDVRVAMPEMPNRRPSNSNYKKSSPYQGSTPYQPPPPPSPPPSTATSAPRQLSFVSLATLFSLNVTLPHRSFLFRRFLSELDVSHIEKHSEECVTAVLPAEIYFAADRLYFSAADNDSSDGWDPHEPYRTAVENDEEAGEQEEAQWGGEVTEEKPKKTDVDKQTETVKPTDSKPVEGKSREDDEKSEKDWVWTPDGMIRRSKWEFLQKQKEEEELIKKKEAEAESERLGKEKGAEEQKVPVSDEVKKEEDEAAKEVGDKEKEKHEEEEIEKASAEKKNRVSDGKKASEAGGLEAKSEEKKVDLAAEAAPLRKLLQLAMASGRGTGGGGSGSGEYKHKPQQQHKRVDGPATLPKKPQTEQKQQVQSYSKQELKQPHLPQQQPGQQSYYGGRYAGHEADAVAELDVAETREKIINADLRPTLRVLPPLLTPLEVESYVEKVSFSQHWSALHDELSSLPPSFRLLVHSSGTGLLSSKAARLFPFSSVVSLATDTETASAHHRLLRLLDLSNNFICLPNVTVTSLHSILRSLPDLFDVQFLPHAFEPLSSVSEHDFLSHLGSLLSLASTTLIPLPNPRRLSLARQLFSPPAEARLFEQIPSTVMDPDQILLDLVSAAAEMGGLRQPELSVLQGSVLRVHATSLSRAIPSHFLPRPLSSSPLARPGISLHTLTTLNLLPSQRRQLVAPLISLGFIAPDMSPWQLVYHAGAILHFPLGGTLTSPSATATSGFDLAEEIAKSVPANGDFSLLDLTAGRGDTSVALAWSFPAATIVSVENRGELIEDHLRRLNKTQLKNNVICQTTPDADLLFRLGESPEFFRLAVTHDPLTLLEKLGEAEFTRFLTYLLPIAQAHYFTFPSPRLLSLCTAILFPSLLTGFDAVPALYAPTSHPLLPFVNYEARLLRDLIDIPGLSAISITSKLPAQSTQSLIRIDLVNLTRTVHHHFDYRIDGHQRSYTLRYENQSTWLVRQTDKSRITYDRFGVSLITLLRMGLTQGRKEEFYSEFLRLPVYEDMATWNIQFKAGKLVYTDRDTEDQHFEKMMPYAYQILLALMNYKRTLQDFDRCGPNNKVEFNFPWIGDCTKNRKFTGPCPQPSAPVPCADGTCKSTFVECARALKQLEEDREKVLSDTKRKIESGEYPSLWELQEEPAVDDAPREKTAVLLNGKRM